MNKLFLSFLLLMISANLVAQHSYKGQIVYEGEPLVAAVIRFDEEGVISDENGEYAFDYSTPKLEATIHYQGAISNVLLIANSYQTLTFTEIPDFVIEPVFISSRYPVTQTTTTSEELKQTNLGQDIPILLEQLPSVVSTSDAGAGVGYSGLRVRGSDATRINVTINGIPLNDSESQGVFWVNMPDFASNTGAVTLVRGVGTSTNGAGAFGASLHLLTKENSNDAYGEYNGSVGSFNTWKNTIQVGSGNLNGFRVDARLSKITSDGYIDRASSDLQSYYIQAAQEFSSKDKLKFITFSGHEETYQAWYGVPQDSLTTNRTYNPYSYDNQVDNYKQTHYQLLYDRKVGGNLYLNTGLHYTKGEGYFEEFKDGERLSDYNIQPQLVNGVAITETDLVRRRWLDNDFYGVISSIDYIKDEHFLKVGGGYNRYIGDHFGEVIQGQFVPQSSIGERYYENEGKKVDGNIYAKYTLDLKNGLSPFVDLQFRQVDYDFVGLTLDGNNDIQALPQSVSHSFLNPKAGLSYTKELQNIYISYSRAQKEPNRNDYTDAVNTELPQAEELNDFELGYSYGSRFDDWSIAANLYHMQYNNQLALTGGVNDVGEYSRVNVKDSFRQGIELQGHIQLAEGLKLAGNATISNNKIEKFIEYVDDFDIGGQQEIIHQDTDLALSPNLIAGAQLGYKTPNQQFEAQLIGKHVGRQYLDNTATESRSIDAYTVNNLSLNFKPNYPYHSLKNLEFNLLINNLFDVEYESNGYTFGYIYGGNSIYENYYYPQAGINFLTGVSVKF